MHPIRTGPRCAECKEIKDIVRRIPIELVDKKSKEIIEIAYGDIVCLDCFKVERLTCVVSCTVGWKKEVPCLVEVTGKLAKLTSDFNPAVSIVLSKIDIPKLVVVRGLKLFLKKFVVNSPVRVLGIPNAVKSVLSYCPVPA